MWSDDDDEEIDKNYNPYCPYQNIKYSKCKNGKDIFNNYCCNKCCQEKKLEREHLRKNFINNMFNNYNCYENNYYKNKKCEDVSINIDWKNLCLIPPKTKKEIKKQYRLLCLKYHPDKAQGNHNRFIKITDSYNNLIN